LFWAKAASNSWGPNIDALLTVADTLDESVRAAELSDALNEEVGNAYLTLSPLGDARSQRALTKTANAGLQANRNLSFSAFLMTYFRI
jgi:hypothetical protein